MAARMLLGLCAAVALVVIGSAASREPTAVVVGVVKCADCTRKNMNAQEVFKGLQVAIKCKNANGECESKALGKLDGSGAFSVPLAADLHTADCHAQLHSAAGKLCPGQEPSTIVPQASEGTFVVVPGKKTQYQSAEYCASATICEPIKKHIMDHFHKKKPVLPKPVREYHPPMPEYHPPTRSSTTPMYQLPGLKSSDTFCGKIKKHFFDHFHKKSPTPEYQHPTPEYHPPTPEYHPPTPVYGQPKPTPIYHPPAKH